MCINKPEKGAEEMWSAHVSSAAPSRLLDAHHSPPPFPPPHTHLPAVSLRSFMWFIQYHFLHSVLYAALNSQGGHEQRRIRWRGELSCVLQRWHSNCQPPLLCLCIFCYTFPSSRISHNLHVTCAAGQNCGLKFSFSAPINCPHCRSPLLLLPLTLHLYLLPSNLCWQY